MKAKRRSSLGRTTNPYVDQWSTHLFGSDTDSGFLGVDSKRYPTPPGRRLKVDERGWPLCFAPEGGDGEGPTEAELRERYPELYETMHDEEISEGIIKIGIEMALTAAELKG